MMNTMMMRSSNSHGHLLLQSSSLLIFLVGTLAASQVAPPDTLVKGSNLTDGMTLVSANRSFTLGFFTRGDPSVARRWYLGIWFTVTNSSTDAVCWVANRDRPLADASGALVVTDTGNLLLLDGSGGTAWSSNITGAASPTARLLDSGNLVLFDAGTGSDSDVNVKKKLWQSFDEPTNTLLPGAKIGIDLWGGGGWSLTSWASPDDPSPGEYRYVMRRGGLLPELVMLDATTGAIVFRTGVWNGLWFSGVPEMYRSYGNQFACQVTVSPSEISFSYTARAAGPALSRLILLGYAATPVVERVGWLPEKHGWSDAYFQGPDDPCDYYGKCGASGLCDSRPASTTWDCGCAHGFSPVSQSDWDMRDTMGGCRRDVPLDCGDTATGRGSTDWFYALQGVKLPDTLNSSLDTNTTLEECRARCLANCSCAAYAPADIRGGGGGGTGCLMWPEPLVDLRYVDGGQTLYIRQATSASGKGKKKITKRMVVLVVLATALVLGSIAVLTLAFLVLKAARIRRRRFEIQIAEAGHTVQNPAVFPIALSTIKSATRNFSSRNVIGEGTFGIVYEGKLPRGHPLLQGPAAGRTIAVKRLKPISDLPETIIRYFTREMQLMSGLKQHQNVLRLLAYCHEANERILVYEYMHRRSLDAYIFGEPKERSLLNWEQRLKIIQGIAEGVKHLHEGEGNVIHRDLKPGNVLLDGGWVAKVADFGTAKLLATGATGTRTRIGTPGYMAPEYVQSDGGETTLKCDVYSFGVTLLETLSGRRNCERPSLVSEAWRLWVDRSVTALLDPAVAPAPAKPELPLLRRCIQVGLLCVQEKPDKRPAMSAVVEMLSSFSSELVEPTVPMVSNAILATLLEADLSRPTVYETIDLT